MNRVFSIDSGQGICYIGDQFNQAVDMAYDFAVRDWLYLPIDSTHP